MFSRRRTQADDRLSLKPAKPSGQGWDSTTSFAPSSTHSNSNSNSNSNAHSFPSHSFPPTSSTNVPLKPPAQPTTGTSIRRRVSTLAKHLSSFKPTSRGRTTQGIGKRRAYSPTYSSRSPSPVDDIRRPSGLGRRASSVDASPSPAGTPMSRIPYPDDKPVDSPRFSRVYPVEEERMPVHKKMASMKMLPRSPTSAGFGFGISVPEDAEHPSELDSGSVKDEEGDGQVIYMRGRTMSTPNVFLTAPPQAQTSTSTFPSSLRSHPSPYLSSSPTSSRSQLVSIHRPPSPSAPSLVVPPSKPEASLRSHAHSMSVSTTTSMVSYVPPDVPTLTATPIFPQFFTPQIITLVPSSTNSPVTPTPSQLNGSHLLLASPSPHQSAPTTPTTSFAPTVRGRRTRARLNPPIPLSLVFEHVPREALPTVALVSKRFCAAAQTAIYDRLSLVLLDNATHPESRRTDMCVARLAASPSHAELVHSFTISHHPCVPRPSQYGSGGSFDFALHLALFNMRHLRALTLPSLEPLITFCPDGQMHCAFLGLRRLKVLSHTLPDVFWRDVLPSMPHLRQLFLPYVKEVDGLGDEDVVELSALTELVAQPTVVARLGKGAPALRRVELCVESTLYEGLRPGEAMHALSRVPVEADAPAQDNTREGRDSSSAQNSVTENGEPSTVKACDDVDLCGSPRGGSPRASTASASAGTGRESSESGRLRRTRRRSGKSGAAPDVVAEGTLQELVLVFGSVVDARTRGKVLLAVGREGVGRGLETLEVRTSSSGADNARPHDEGFYKQITTLLPHTPILRALRLVESRQPTTNAPARSMSLPPSLPPVLPKSARPTSFLFPLPPPSPPVPFASFSPPGTPPSSPPPPKSPLGPRTSSTPSRRQSTISSESPSPRTSESPLPITPAARVAHWGRLAPTLERVLLAGQTWTRADNDEWEVVE
ncbi:hypothetical protein OF83DRAFT_1176402 [Amylostereum chailletii]|nr:hypothetical protein OF83DRAFT_1176402 [Amylostereum chailletii]